MALNGRALNTTAVNAAAQTIIGIGSGSLISIEQTVALIGSGSLISIEQDVQLRLSSTIAESLISVEQIVEAQYTAGLIIGLEQSVKNSALPNHLSRTGWDAVLVVGGYTVPTTQITDSIRIIRTENDAALMDVIIRPTVGLQDLDTYQGKTVTLDIQNSSGIFRAYTGVVDIPEIDLLNETITLRCTDKRTEQLNNQLPGIVASLGIYSSHIFATPQDIADEVEQRLSTIPYALDFDAYGNYTLTPWAAKATADFTLTDSGVYKDKPVVEFTNRGRITNQVNINFQYRYERFHHITRFFQWRSPIADNICLLLDNSYSMTFKTAVESAIDAAGWPILGEVTHTPMWDGGWYTCGNQPVNWTNIQFLGTNEPVLDAQGNQIKDSSGEPVYKQSITSAIDYSNLYTMAADWYATKQFSQNITENFTLTLNATQSQAQFGIISKDVNYAIDDSSADIAAWENYEAYRTVSSDLNYNIDQDLKRNEFSLAISTALNQAKTTILRSHRDTRVSVDTFIWPELDLKHTVEINTSDLTAKGKVFQFEHTLNIGTGEARTKTTLLLSKANGSASNSNLSIPSKISDNIVYTTDSIRLGNHYGEDPTTDAAKAWNGFIGNKRLDNNLFRTNYQEQFIVDTPELTGELRDNKELSSSSSYTVEIPDDTLTITFDGKL